jgi:hypothetical protein
MLDFAAVSLTYHGALLVGAVAAYYKYGDRTEVTEKSLKGTKEALDGLRAYLGRALSESVRPTVERIIANAPSPEAVLEELRGEAFRDDVSSFVNSDIDELLSYRRLFHARGRWSVWSRRISWAVFIFLLMQAVFTCYFAIVGKVLNHTISLTLVLVTFSISAVMVAFCVFCAGVMLYYHDKISSYRDKIL